MLSTVNYLLWGRSEDEMSQNRIIYKLSCREWAENETNLYKTLLHRPTLIRNSIARSSEERLWSLLCLSPLCLCVHPCNECVGWTSERFHGQRLHLYILFSKGALTNSTAVWATSLCFPPACQKEWLMWGGCLVRQCLSTWIGPVLSKNFWLSETRARNPRQVFFVSFNFPMIHLRYLQRWQWHSSAKFPVLSLSFSLLSHPHTYLYVCFCFVWKGGADENKKGNHKELQDQLSLCKKELQQAHDE